MLFSASLTPTHLQPASGTHLERLHGREVPGNGIGLAICCRIVSHYGGRIWVEESPQGGARFCFTVPDGPRRAMRGQEEREPLLLMVEDNTPDILLLREALLAGAPRCQIQVLTTGEQAWQFFRREAPYADARRPDLVILDFSLPGRDGGEIASLIRRTAELDRVPVLMVSSAPSSYVQERAPEADAHWTKPTDLDEFLALGQKILQFLARSR